MELGDTRTVAEALAMSKKADLAAQMSDEKANHNRLEKASRMAEIEDLQHLITFHLHLFLLRIHGSTSILNKLMHSKPLEIRQLELKQSIVM
ncbi:hypothetical protein MKX01_026803 [Papaver californicum]|nr:hypothetical protein MKX01_026803 [Papaver californicum]